MTGLLDYIFGAASFMPHGYCLLWRPDLVLMHGLGDTAIAISYLIIAAALLSVREHFSDRSHRLLINIFGLFIGFCALTHMIGVLTLWVPLYGAQGLMKLATAMISITAAIIVLRFGPQARQAIQLKNENDVLRADMQLAEAAEARLREREKDLRAALSHAKAASASKSDFLAAMSHDLRTPLNAIIGFSDGMLSGHLTAPPGESERRYLTHIHDSGNRLLVMVNEILDLASMTQGGLKPDLKEIALEETLLVPVSEVEALAKERDVSVLFTPYDGPEMVVTDPSVIQRIATNLLGNAIRHAPDGGYARLSCTVKDDMLSLVVEDSGPGFPVGRISEVRQPFVTFEAERGGRGLGLAIVDGLCHAANGRLLITNRPEGGARVEACITLGQPATAVSGTRRSVA